MHRYKDLEVWKKAMDLAEKIYSETNSFPDEEKFGLISQMRRCAVSVASNIAEGAGRNSNKEFNQFLGIAQGSAFELETQVLLSKRLKFLSEEAEKAITSEVNVIANMIFKLKKNLKY